MANESTLPERRLVISRQTRKGQHFLEPLNETTRLDMMQIPGGSFMMGSPETELDRLGREGPQHQVSVPAFFMGKCLITQAQWRFVAGLEQVNRELESDPSRFKGDNHPVEEVSWYEAVEFCDRLSRHTGREYRLPTEAEWEYACRAGTETPFHFGETTTTDLANYNGTHKEYGAYGRGLKGEYRRETTPVNHFDIANAWGLSDMHGNVWEWCLDHWHDSYEGAPEDSSAWLTDDKKARRILRGGSWISSPRICRSACRLINDPDDRNDDIGFRVVCVAPKDSSG